MHVNIAGRIRTQPQKQTGSLGEALKARLAEREQTEQAETNLVLTLSPRPHGRRINFDLHTEAGELVKLGHFLDPTHAQVVITRMLEKHPTITVLHKKDGGAIE